MVLHKDHEIFVIVVVFVNILSLILTRYVSYGMHTMRIIA